MQELIKTRPPHKMLQTMPYKLPCKVQIGNSQEKAKSNELELCSKLQRVAQARTVVSQRALGSKADRVQSLLRDKTCCSPMSWQH